MRVPVLAVPALELVARTSRSHVRRVTFAALAAAIAWGPVADRAAAQEPTVTLTLSPTSVAESKAVATDISVTATISELQTGSTTVTLSLSGTANEGTDYSVAGTLPSVTVPSGSTTASATFTVTPIDDTFWEGSETIVVDGSSTGDLEVTGATLTLSDNDTRPSIRLYFDPSSVSGLLDRIPEDRTDSTSYTLHAALVGGSTLEVATAITLSWGGQAVHGTDFTATLPAMEISAGSTTDSGSLTVTPIDNSRRDGFRSFHLLGAADDHLGNAFTFDVRNLDLGITDDEPPLQIDISVTPALIREADFVADTSVSLDVSVTLPGEDTLLAAVTVELSALFDTCGLVNPSYDLGEIEFPMGSTATSLTQQKTLSIPRRADSIDRECDLVVRAAATGYRSGLGSVRVIPDEAPSLTRVGILASTRIPPSNIATVGERVVVRYTFNRHFRLEAGGSASTTLRFGETTRTSSCTLLGGSIDCDFPVLAGQHDLDGFQASDLGALTITGSTVDFYDRTIPLTVDTAIPAGRIEVANFTVVGARAAYRLNPSIESIQENSDPTDITVTGTWLYGLTSSSDITFPIAFTDVTTSAADYTVSGTQSITVTGGEASGSTTLSVTAIEDGLKEARTEIVRIGGGNGSYYVVGTDLELIDSPTIQLSVPSLTVAENGSAQTVTVTAELGDPSDSPRPRPIVVALDTSGTAGDGDYTIAETLQVTIPANARSGTATLTLTPVDDRLLEEDETIVVTGSTPGLTVVGGGTITLQDDETEPEVILTANPNMIREDGSVSTQVTVSAALAPDIVLPDDATVVTLSLGGTATEGMDQDYTGAWDADTPQITIPQGQRDGEATVTLTLTPQQDEVVEGPETIVVEGTASTALVVDVRGSTITLVDDDVPDIVLAPASIEITEGGMATYTVALAREPTEQVTVTMTTALSGTDLSVDKSVLHFTQQDWDEPQTVTVTARDDEDAVADDTLTLRHEASGGAYERVVSEASVTIKENDAPNVTVSQTVLLIPEGMNDTYSVVLTSQPTDDVTVTMETNLAGTDLSTSPSPTTLTFTDVTWDDPQTVTVSAAVDADAFDDPAVTLQHTVSGGDYEDVTVSPVTVTIVEQTVPELSVTGGTAEGGASASRSPFQRPVRRP